MHDVILAYALMVYIRNNWFKSSVPIMKWLQTMRNTDNGFCSTQVRENQIIRHNFRFAPLKSFVYILTSFQDTIVALEALTEFAYRDTNRGLYSLRLDIDSTSSTDFQKQVRLHRNNFLEYQQFEIPAAFGSVRAVVHGTGYALLQVNKSLITVQ